MGRNMSNISEYSIINTKEIEEEIEKLGNYKLKTGNEDKRVKSYSETEIVMNRDVWNNLIEDSKNYAKFELLKEILNNSISLEDVIKDAFEAGNEAEDVMYKGEFTGKLSPSFEDYIKNLTIKK